MKKALLMVPLAGVLTAGATAVLVTASPVTMGPVTVGPMTVGPVTTASAVAAAGRVRAVRYLEAGHSGAAVRFTCGHRQNYTGLNPYYPLAVAGSECHVRIWLREFVPPLGGPAWCVSPGQPGERVPAEFRYAADIQVTGNGHRCPRPTGPRRGGRRPGGPAVRRLAASWPGVT